MKYKICFKDEDMMVLDYKIPIWLYAIFKMFVTALVYVVTVDIKVMLALLVVELIVVYYMFDYTKKRPIKIYSDVLEFEIDKEMYSFNDINRIVVMGFSAANKVNFIDNIAPGNKLAKQTVNAIATYVVLKNGKVIRVYYGSKRRALKEAERFKKILKFKKDISYG